VSIIRKKKGAEEPFDPVSASAWAAAALAVSKVSGLIDSETASTEAAKKLRLATVLTPCALDTLARTKPSTRWTYDEFTRVVKVAESLREIVILDMADATSDRSEAASAVLGLISHINDKWLPLVKRQRAFERLSGEPLRRL